MSGMRSTLIDDFADPINVQIGDDVLNLHREYGVTILRRDVIRDGLGLPPRSMDAVTTFDSMEHWHASPKALFREVRGVLRPGGMFLLGVPNSVNVKKRLLVPLGKGKWSAMADWYELPVFRGHVREADVDDLRYIARDMGLRNVEIRGRNWLGTYSPNPTVRRVSRALDRVQRLRPSLCSDLYLTGRV
jgi:SAM-dependent methyltransferase